MLTRSLFAVLLAILFHTPSEAAHQMEHLDRGLVVLRTGTNEVLLSWRLLGDEPPATTFNAYRSEAGGSPILLNSTPLNGSTQFIDTTADLPKDNTYHIRAIHNGVGQPLSKPFLLPGNSPIQSHIRLPLDKPADVADDGTVSAHSYSANDCSVADLDGDGDYEFLVKWNPSNAKDNAQSGHTGRVYLDAYQLDGTRLWRIDLGINIRAGAHYTQFIAYDFDGDGKAEIACRTAPGATDGQGDDVADPAKWQDASGPPRPTFSPSDDYRNAGGYILEGPEFITLFDGLTGDELVSTNYIPFRDPDNSDHSPTTSRINQVWGDNYGNRIDRFLAGAAYLDGTSPSLVMTRGYYTRTILAAWDWRGGNLARRWVFDSNDPGNGAWAGQGAHSLTVGDTDLDGNDEIVFGSCAIDHDGTGLYSLELGTGDALHMSDMDPDRPGLEVWMVHESPSTYGVHGSVLNDGATGQIIFSVDSSDDIGRGVAADADPRTVGFEAWSSRANIHDVDGNEITTTRPGQMNFLCWWDGDLLRELLDGTTISKWDWNSNSTSSLLSPSGISSNNSTKATPNLSADLFGDWREEVVWRESDSSALRIYSSTIPTPHRIPTLMHDRQYRLAIAWQNVGYNQPPHPGYYLGDGMGTVPLPDFTTVSPPGAPTPVADRFPDWLVSRGLAADLDPDLDHDGNGMTLMAEYAFDVPNQVPISIRPEGADIVLGFAAVRDEMDYRVESSNNLVDWSELITIAGIPDGPVDLQTPISEARCFYRAVAVSTHNASSGPVTTTYAAEDASAGPQLWAVESSNPGFHGTGYINSDTTGSFIEFTNIDGGSGGNALLSFRHALGAAGTRSGLLIINGVSQSITFSSTGSWSTWGEHEVTVSLNPGTTNTIRLETTGEDLANIDELTVTIQSTPQSGPSVALNLPTLAPYQTGNIFIIGDSTVANYGSNYYPQKGWGQLFQEFIDPTRFVVTNRARGGRSSKSFIVEGLWDSLKAELSPGDYVLIQWGHNDRDFTKPERYTTEPEFKGYLTQYINEARALGTIPVFVTPMVMNAWSGNTMRNVFTESGNNYAGWMKEIATTLDVPLIDLNQKSHELFSPLDYDTVGRFYFHTYVAGEYPNYPSGHTDGTHFQEMGALTMAKFVADGFREIDPDPRVSALANGLEPQYPLAIQANLPAAARVNLNTELPAGSTFHLKALAEAGSSFINWKDGANQSFSTNSLTTFPIAPQSYQLTAYLDNETPVPAPAAGTIIPGGDPFDYTITLSAQASDPEETVVLVEYFHHLTNEKIGDATSAPYALYWEADSGVYQVRAESVNSLGTRTVSEVIQIDTEAPNTAPTATLTSPANGSTFDAGDSVALTATASDPDGIITKVVFSVDGTYLSEDSTAPYTADWTDIPGGSHVLSARAIDDRGTASADSSVNVSVNFGTTGALLQEAEAGTLVGSYVVINDAAASNGQAVEAVSGPADTNYVEFQFNVPTTGNYRLRVRIKAIDGNHDSMFVSFDGGAADQILWDTARSTTYVDDYVFNRGEADPLIINLTAGSHTVRLGYRENLFIDQVELELAP